ncbi:MAG: hypothetical protein V4517_07775, partial [Pseudomonadota bacterium]
LRTRDRGCSAHPAFPAPFFGGENDRHTSGDSRRGIADVYSVFEIETEMYHVIASAAKQSI